MQGLLLRERGPVFAVHRFQDLVDFGAQLGFSRLHDASRFRRFRMRRTVPLGDLCLLALRLGEVVLQSLDVLVRQHRRKRIDRAGGLRRFQLVVERFLVNAFRLGLDQRRVQIRQLLNRHR